MHYLLTKFLNYSLALAMMLLVVYLSFFTPPHTKLDHVFGIDKLVHCAMYFCLSGCIILEHFFDHKLRRRRALADVVMWRLLLVSVVFPIVFSCCIELLQEYCTSGRRSGEWLDVAANSLGCLLPLTSLTLPLRNAQRWQRRY